MDNLTQEMVQGLHQDELQRIYDLVDEEMQARKNRRMHELGSRVISWINDYLKAGGIIEVHGDQETVSICWELIEIDGDVKIGNNSIEIF